MKRKQTEKKNSRWRQRRHGVAKYIKLNGIEAAKKRRLAMAAKSSALS